MDAEEEESSRKRSLEEEQDSVTASDAPQELPIAGKQCESGLQHMPGGGEMAAAPLVTASSGDEKDVIGGELSTCMEDRDEAEVVEEKDNSVKEVGEMKGVVIGAEMSAGIKDTMVNEDIGVGVKKEEELTDLPNGGCGVEVIEEEDKVVVEMENVPPEVKDEDSVELKTEAPEKENDICMPDAVEKKVVPISDEIGTNDASMKVNDGLPKITLADKTDVADMAIETKKAEEEEDGAIMPDKAVESEEKLAGAEMADRADVSVTRSEAIEADGVGIDDNSMEIGDRLEVAEEVNVVSMVGATAEEEGADGDGAQEEASEAEETQAANEADFASEEADVVDMTADTEAAEEAEEMEVAEDQSRRVSGRKRKGGRNPKSTGRVSARKNLEEDVCFICFDGGDLVLCDRR